ncbi:MAG: type VI secretion system tube protein Hcp [Armatimonas sp.]
MKTMRPISLLTLVALSLTGFAHARPADPKPAPVASLVQRDAFPRPALMLKETGDKDLPEALTTARDGSLAILSVEFGTSAESSFLKGGGASVGKPLPSSLTIKRVSDRSSAAFWTKIVTGRNFPKLVIALGGGIVLTLEDVFVTNIRIANDQGTPPTESISVVFKTLRYEVQDTSGRGQKPTGFIWDIAAMKLTQL